MTRTTFSLVWATPVTESSEHDKYSDTIEEVSSMCDYPHAPSKKGADRVSSPFFLFIGKFRLCNTPRKTEQNSGIIAEKVDQVQNPVFKHRCSLV